MKKLLLVVDGTTLDMNSVNFACYLARLCKTKITGVFLENLDCEKIYVSKRNKEIRYVDTAISTDLEENISVRKKCEENIHRFKEACIEREVPFIIHRDRGVPLKELIEESRFADILIADADTAFSDKIEEVPSKLTENILANAECPVIIAPESFDAINQVVFAYDGSASSMFAIRQFTYLFPNLWDTKLLVITTGDKMVNKYKIKEWMKYHYADVEFYELGGETNTALLEYALSKENAFIVMGAFGRSLISNFFRASTADSIVKFVSQPLFIAHH